MENGRRTSGTPIIIEIEEEDMIPKKVSDVLFPNALYFTDLKRRPKGPDLCLSPRHRLSPSNVTDRGRTQPPGHLRHDPLASSGGQGMGVWMGLIKSPDPSCRPRSAAPKSIF